MMHKDRKSIAPELDVVAWLNTNEPITLAKLRGNIVVIHAFQMLCPGCVTHGIPQASAIHQLYQQEKVEVIGLHTVFEHHNVMTADALKAFIHEYRVPFPIAIDTPCEKTGIPNTMAKYHMQGTPTLIILDKKGCIRLNHFGRMSDMQVGSIIGKLLEETDSMLKSSIDLKPSAPLRASECDEDGCAI